MLTSMRTILFFTFLVSLAKAGLLMTVGILVKNHFDTLLSIIVRKPIPEILIDSNKLEKTNHLIKWIGIFIIITAICMAVAAIFTFAIGARWPRMDTGNFNFNF